MIEIGIVSFSSFIISLSFHYYYTDTFFDYIITLHITLLTLTYITLNIADNHWQFHFHFNSWDCHWLFFELSSILRPLTFSLLIIYRYILLSFIFIHWAAIDIFIFTATPLAIGCWLIFHCFRYWLLMLIHYFQITSFIFIFFISSSFHFISPLRQLSFSAWLLLTLIFIDYWFYWYFHSLHWYAIITPFSLLIFLITPLFSLLFIDYWLFHYFIIIYYIIIISLLILILHYYITLISLIS
jgi:hypothetical protein